MLVVQCVNDAIGPFHAPLSTPGLSDCQACITDGQPINRRTTGRVIETGAIYAASKLGTWFDLACKAHPQFLAGGYTTRFLDETPELFQFAERKDRATRVLTYIGEVIVNGHHEAAVRNLSAEKKKAIAREEIVTRSVTTTLPNGTKQILDKDGRSLRICTRFLYMPPGAAEYAARPTATAEITSTPQPAFA